MLLTLAGNVDPYHVGSTFKDGKFGCTNKEECMVHVT